MNQRLVTLLIAVTTLSFANISSAASDDAKANYTAATEAATSDYKLAREKCNALTGNAKAICQEEANAQQVRTKSEAEALYKNTSSANVSARNAIADADHDLAKAKCASQTGNAKDVCLKEAKAANVAAHADAKADKKVRTARKDARSDKLDANYKVALEKCDAMTGPAKDSCVASAKTAFSK